jgi:hypothetical protein
MAHSCKTKKNGLILEGGNESDSTDVSDSVDAVKPSLDLKSVYNHGRLRGIAQEVAASYDVEFCVVSLKDPADNGFNTAACFGSDPSIPWKSVALRASRLFQIMVKRGAPTIIEDTRNHGGLKDDALAKASGIGEGLGCPIHFLVELPLRVEGHYFGTICLVDSKARKFKLFEAELLENKARELIDSMSDLGYFDRFEHFG